MATGTSLAIAIPATSNTSGNVEVGGFEIDGNFYEGFDNDTTATGPDGDPVDWGSAEIQPEVDSVPDVIGGGDESIFDQGSKEDDLETWNDSGSAAAPQNGDIGNTWVFDRIDPDTGDQYAYIAFLRSTDTGSIQWYVELNQLPNTQNANGTTIPDRSVGDLRISIENQGGGQIEVVGIEAWDGDSWEDTGVEVPSAINDSDITIEGETVEEQLFIELAFNLTDIFGDDEPCTFTGFSTLNLRSQSGLGANSELKDYATGDIDIASPCGEIRIEKRDPDGTLLGGATFEITPDPTPGSGAPSLSVTDNEAPDIDPADGVIVVDPAEPGDYTITEVTPPPGYIQTTEPQDVTVEEFGSVTVVFTNRLGTITWSKLDEQDQSAICCATFEVSPNPLIGAPADPPLTVTDNEAPDTDPAAGVITIEDVKTGTYTITETVPPEGYGLPGDPVRADVVVDAETPDVVIDEAFEDPRLPSELSVLKLDADTDDPLAGATFALYLDDGDGTPEAPGGDTLVDDCVTAGDGTCTIGDLDFGTYYWFEVSAPTGYELPANRYSDLVVVDATNAGDEFTPVTFEDPQVRSELTVLKLDAETGEPLGGAAFDLVRDDGDGAYEPDEDTVVGSCITSDADGTCTIGDLLFGTYFWVETAAPTGYDLPADPVSDPVVVNASNAGTEITVATFEDPQIRTDLTVLKIDAISQGPLAGAAFDLYLDDGDGVGDAPDDGDLLVDSCTTADDGMCTIAGLTFGDYYWYETAAPEGYDLPQDRTSTIIVVTAETAGEEFVYTFTNPRRPGELTVLKVDDVDGTPLAGATFDLVLDDGDGVYEADEDTVVATCPTGDNGTCTVEDLDFGTYFWVEVAAPTGYELPADTVSDPIVIDASNVDDERTPFEFRDPRILSELTVLKVDAADETLLAGGEFDLVLDDGDGTYEADEDTVFGSCVTGDDGRCTVDGLDFGTYFWVETAAPTGYELPEDPVSDPIVIDASNAGGELTVVTFFDPRILSELTVMKVDDVDDAPLAGAEFDLVLDDGDEVYEPDEDAVIRSCVTGDDGTCTVDGLDFATFFWVETAAPPGYDLPANPVSDPITITAETAGTEFPITVFRDPRLLSELSVLKLAEDTEEPLAGGVFELYLDDGDGVGTEPDEGDVLVGECTTAVDGLCAIGDLGFGDYYWYETQAPEGYLLPEDRTSDVVTIDASNAGTSIAPVEFVDPPEAPTPTPTPTEPELPDTGLADTAWAVAWGAAGLVALGSAVLIQQRRSFGTRG